MNMNTWGVCLDPERLGREMFHVEQSSCVLNVLNIPYGMMGIIKPEGRY